MFVKPVSTYIQLQTGEIFTQHCSIYKHESRLLVYLKVTLTQICQDVYPSANRVIVHMICEDIYPSANRVTDHMIDKNMNTLENSGISLSESLKVRSVVDNVGLKVNIYMLQYTYWLKGTLVNHCLTILFIFNITIRMW